MKRIAPAIVALIILFSSGCSVRPALPDSPKPAQPAVLPAAQETAKDCPLLRRVSSGGLSPLESLLGLSPADSRVARIDAPQIVRLLRGTVTAAFLTGPDAATVSRLASDIVQQGRGEVVNSGRWTDIWPLVIECVKERPVLSLYYGRMGNHEPLWAARLATGFPSKQGLDSDGGRLALNGNAIFIAPSHEPGDAWLIATSQSPPDIRYANPFAYDIDGYSRSGLVVVIKLESTDKVRELASLGERLLASAAGLGIIEQEIRAGRDAEALDNMQKAHDHYLKALVTGGGLSQHHPELLFRLGRAQSRLRKDVHVGTSNMLSASYLAEQQGDATLLQQIADELQRIPPADVESDLAKAVLMRLTEIRPTDGDIWWRLADLYPQAVELAEQVRRPASGDTRAALIYLRAAASDILQAYAPVTEDNLRWDKNLVDRAVSRIERSKQIDKRVRFGYFLSALIEGRIQGDYAVALNTLKQVPGGPATNPDIERYLKLIEARGQEDSPVLSIDLGKPGEQYFVSGSPWFCTRDGNRLGVVVRAHSPKERSEVVMIDLASGRVISTPATDPNLVGWSIDSSSLYYTDGGLMRLDWGETKPATLATRARYARLSPDGQKTVFMHDGLWLINNQTLEITALSGGMQDSLPLWYPDSRNLLFAKDTAKPGGDGSPNLKVLAQVDTLSREVRLLDSAKRHYASLDWVVPGEVLGAISGWDDLFSLSLVSIDGSTVDIDAFGIDLKTCVALVPGRGTVQVRWGQTPGTLDLIASDIHGTKSAPTRFGGFEGMPVFSWLSALGASPGGNRLAYVYETYHEGPALWITSLEGRTHHLVTRESSGDMVWFPEEDRIALFDGRTLRIYAVPDGR